MQAAKAIGGIRLVIEHLMLKIPVDDSLTVKSGHKKSELWPHSGWAAPVVLQPTIEV
jgi:hypothetical protein